MFTKCEERAGQEGTSLGIQLDGLGELRLKGRHQVGATYLGIRNKEFLLRSWRATIAERGNAEGEEQMGEYPDSSQP